MAKRDRLKVTIPVADAPKVGTIHVPWFIAQLRLNLVAIVEYLCLSNRLHNRCPARFQVEVIQFGWTYKWPLIRSIFVYSHNLRIDRILIV